MDCESQNGGGFPQPHLALLGILRVRNHIERDTSLNELPDLVASFQSAVYWLQRFGIKFETTSDPFDSLVRFIKSPSELQPFASANQKLGRAFYTPDQIARDVDSWLWLGASDSWCELAFMLRSGDQLVGYPNSPNIQETQELRSQYKDLVRYIENFRDLVSSSIKRVRDSRFNGNENRPSPVLETLSIISPDSIDEVGALVKHHEEFGFQLAEPYCWMKFKSTLQDQHIQSVNRLCELLLERIPESSEFPPGWEPITTESARGGRHFPETPIRSKHDLKNWLGVWLRAIQGANGKGVHDVSGLHQSVCRELRNSRRAFKPLSIPRPTWWDETPADIYEGERQLERLIQSLTELIEDENRDRERQRIAAKLLEEMDQTQILDTLNKGIESTRELIRLLGKLNEPVSKGTAQRCRSSLERLTNFPSEVSVNHLLIAAEYGQKWGVLFHLTEQCVDWLARRMGLDRTKLRKNDAGEWELALVGEPGSEFATSTPNRAAFASMNKLPTSKPEEPPSADSSIQTSPIHLHRIEKEGGENVTSFKTTNPGASTLNDRYETAYRAFEIAERELGSDVSDAAAYEWLKENGPEFYDMPQSFSTWQRYVREGRKYYGTQKNTSRAGRTGRSLITPDSLDAWNDEE